MDLWSFAGHIIGVAFEECSDQNCGPISQLEENTKSLMTEEWHFKIYLRKRIVRLSTCKSLVALDIESICGTYPDYGLSYT